MVTVSSGRGSKEICIGKLLQELKRQKSSPKCMYQHLSYILFIPHDFEMPLEGAKALKIFMHANAGRLQQRKGESDMTIKNSFTVLTPDP
jgi:hypothetical protein